MFKRLLFTLLVAAAAIPLPARDFQYTYAGQTLTYTVLNEDAKTCKTKEGSWSSGGNSISGKLILPSVVTDGVNDYTLTQLGAFGFYKCTSLTSISIPSSVKYVGKKAFDGCSNFDCVEFESIEHMCEINYEERDACPVFAAKSLLINGNEVKSIIIPNTVTSIGKYAFSGCKSVTSILIPNSVITIGEFAFSHCPELTHVIYAATSCHEARGFIDFCDNLHQVFLANNFRILATGSITSPSIEIYTFPNCISEAIKTVGIRPLTMPGIDINATPSIDKINLKIKIDEGAELNGVFFHDGIIESINDEYEIRNLTPCNTFSVNFKVANEYYDDWILSQEYSTNPLESMRVTNTSQSTIALTTNFFADKRISNRRINVSGTDFIIDSKGNVTVSGLVSNQTYTPFVYASFDGKEYNCGSIQAKTLPVNPSINAEVSPTSVTIKCTMADKGDAVISSENFMVNNTNYQNKTQRFVNQPLRSTYTVRYSVNNEQTEASFELPELELTTIAARAASKDCAIICAETNMSEEEYGGGFEWRRYDAPDMVPSTFSPCPVANGHMEGRLRGLSTNTYYKYRPYYEDCNGNRTFGQWTAFITADADVYFEPTVYTYAPNSVTKNSATVVGYAIGGSEDVDEQGFEYWPTVGSRATTDVRRVLATGQRMTATLEDLEPGTRYTVRAFATTKTKTTYGDNQEFETDGEPESAIEPIAVDETEVQPFDIYTLSGVLVRRHTTDLSGLRPGLYIANGKKILVH